MQTDRREFLRFAAGAAAAVVSWGGNALAAEPRPAPVAELPEPERRKVILVVFGGGTRSSEAVADPEHRYIPHLWKELVPRGTLFTNMRVEHRVVHPNCNASIKTGFWEYDDLDWSKPPKHPTVFEIFRKRRAQPDTAAWSFVYASILAMTGESSHADYGSRYAANIVQPPTIPRTTGEEMDRLMRQAAATGSPEAERKAAVECARLARENSHVDTAGLRSPAAREWFAERFEAWRRAEGSSSHDAFLADCAIACMEKFLPGVMSIDFGEIDCAHYGSWSRYVEAIRRTDELTTRLWQAAEKIPAYRGKTLFLVLPDHGRELERPGGSGFLHHGDFYRDENADEGCRRIWMLAIGPGVSAGKTIERVVPITSTSATVLTYLGLPVVEGAAEPALKIP
jgi:hypothetical protein